jgi:hypothetical protein
MAINSIILCFRSTAYYFFELEIPILPKKDNFLYFRPLSAPTGGLCGLASMYLALSSTLLTKSQLTMLNYTGMKETIATEMAIPDMAGISDTQLLRQFYSCKLYEIFWSLKKQTNFNRVDIFSIFRD